MPKEKENKYQENTGKEICVPSSSLRYDAISFVSSEGKNTLVVTKWINAGRPSGHPETARAKTGITGYVLETKQTFTVRDDWDFRNGVKGKGYHVNATLGDVKKAFVRDGGNSDDHEYFLRTITTADKHFVYGPEEAVGWYVGAPERNIKWKYEPKDPDS